MCDYLIPNLANACEIMTLLSRADDGMPAIEIENELNIPRTTVFRILKTLCHKDIVEKRGRIYSVGNRLVDMGLQVNSSNKLKNKSVPILQKLAQQSGFTAHLAVPSGFKSLILEVCDSPNPIRVASRQGTIAPLNCSSTGKVFAAHLYRDKIKEIEKSVGFERRTIYSIASAEGMEKETQKVLSTGYGIDNREYAKDVICLAAPTFDQQGKVIAAIGVTAPASIFPETKVPDIARLVKSCASDLYFSLKQNSAVLS